MMTIALYLVLGSPTASIAINAPAVQWIDAAYEVSAAAGIKDSAPIDITDEDCDTY